MYMWTEVWEPLFKTSSGMIYITVILIMTNCNLQNTLYKTKHIPQSTNMTKLTCITFAAPGFVLTWRVGRVWQQPPVAPQVLDPLQGPLCTCVDQTLLWALTLVRAKAFFIVALLISIGYTHAQPTLTDPFPTKPGKHNAILSWPAGRRISQTCWHSLSGTLECPSQVPPGPDTYSTRPAASDCNSTN
jgi:hypothetical protein